jgi:hypothetical protein
LTVDLRSLEGSPKCSLPLPLIYISHTSNGRIGFLPVKFKKKKEKKVEAKIRTLIIIYFISMWPSQ